MSNDCLQRALQEEFIFQVVNASINPGLYLSRTGTHNDDTWLLAGDRVSNIVGVPFGYDNGKMIKVVVANEVSTTFDIEIYHHLGNEASLTLLTTVVIVTNSVQTFSIADFGSVPIPQDVQIAAKVVNTTATKPRATGIYITALGN